MRILYRSIPTDLVAAQPLTTGIRRIDGELAGVTEEAVPPFRFSRMDRKGLSASSSEAIHDVFRCAFSLWQNPDSDTRSLGVAVKRLVEYRIDPEGKQTVVVEVDEPLEETGEERAGFLSWKSPTPASEDLEGSFDRITPAANLLMSKQLAEYLGFRWDGSGRDGLWASAKWREAYGLRDRRGRGRLLTDITEYNRQDVAATWEVLSWLLRRTGQLGSAEELRART